MAITIDGVKYRDKQLAEIVKLYKEYSDILISKNTEINESVLEGNSLQEVNNQLQNEANDIARESLSAIKACCEEPTPKCTTIVPCTPKELPEVVKICNYDKLVIELEEMITKGCIKKEIHVKSLHYLMNLSYLLSLAECHDQCNAIRTYIRKKHAEFWAYTRIGIPVEYVYIYTYLNTNKKNPYSVSGNIGLNQYVW